MTVCFYGCVTMDGYLADENGGLDWLYQSGSIADTGYDEFYSKIDVTIMGKKTFDEVAKIDYADAVYPTSTNYVFTHDKVLPLAGYIPVAADVTDFVKHLDQNTTVWVIGGHQILAPLLDHDLIDTMIIQVAPVLLGKGIPLFTQAKGLKPFSLEKMNRYGQIAELIYQKKV